jgi:hypothetical protein
MAKKQKAADTPESAERKSPVELLQAFIESRQKFQDALSKMRQVRDELASRLAWFNEVTEQRKLVKFRLAPPGGIASAHIEQHGAAIEQMTADLSQRASDVVDLEAVADAAMAELMAVAPDAI